MNNKPSRATTITSSVFVGVSLAVGLFGVPGCGGSDAPGVEGSSGSKGNAGGAPSQGGRAELPAGGALPLGGSAASVGSAGFSATGGSGSSGLSAGGAAGSVAQGGSASSAAGSTNAGAGGRAGGPGQGSGGAPSGAAGSTGTGTCTASKPVSVTVSGSGPHKVTVETNADSGIKEGTIYRPSDLGGSEKYPILVWGNGACSQDGLSNTAAMAEIASHGYFVVADGTPKGSGGRSQTSNWVAMGKPLLAYVSWAIAENGKSCSAYHDSLDTTKIASNGFSCGGLMSEGTAGDSRMTSVGITSSGLTSADQAFYKTVHTPFLIILGGTSDIAYDNGERDYDSLSALGIPIMLFSKNIGHGGDLGSARGGDFTKINLAWLNWRLKGDEGASGKGALIGASCTYCSNSAWEVKSKNIP